MKALQIIEPHHTALINLEMPELKRDEVLIRVMACGICGTDIHIFRGQYMGTYPMIPGHELSGVIEETGKEVTRFHTGDRVSVEPNLSCDNCPSCLNNRQNFCENWQALGVTLPGGMAQYVIAPEKSVFNIGTIPFEQGAFMEPLSCVLHGIERLNMDIAERVLINGSGPIGLLFLQIIRKKGAVHIAVLEKQPSRAEMAEKLGANRIFSQSEKINNNSFDTVIDTTGHPAVIGRSVDHVRRGGKILLFGVPRSGEKIQLDGFTFFKKGLFLNSSFTSVRNSYQAIDMLQSEQLRISNLISHTLPLNDFERGVHMIENTSEKVLKIMISPHEQ